MAYLLHSPCIRYIDHIGAQMIYIAILVVSTTNRGPRSPEWLGLACGTISRTDPKEVILVIWTLGYITMNFGYAFAHHMNNRSWFNIFFPAVVFFRTATLILLMSCFIITGCLTLFIRLHPEHFVSSTTFLSSNDFFTLFIYLIFSGGFLRKNYSN